MTSLEQRRTCASSALLVLTAFSVFGTPFFSTKFHAHIYTYSFSALFIAAVYSTDRHRKFISLAALVAIALEVITDWIEFEFLNQVSRLMSLLFFFAVVYLLLSQIVRQRQVTPRVILEAINGYLLLGLCFSMLFALAMWLDKGAFSFPEDQAKTMGYNYIYFAFVTMSTLGYGEIVPLTPGAKSLAVLASVTGQLYLTVVIALLVGKYIGFWSAQEMAGPKNSHR